MTDLNDLTTEQLAAELARRRSEEHTDWLERQEGMHLLVGQLLNAPSDKRLSRQLEADLERCLGRCDRELFRADPSRFRIQFDISYSPVLADRKGHG